MHNRPISALISAQAVWPAYISYYIYTFLFYVLFYVDIYVIFAHDFQDCFPGAGVIIAPVAVMKLRQT